ncbi:MAG: diaminopimelate epimerase [Alphaproteobacteria bacterium]|nr:diaminopimelate epimerase [Alphaproteobacteria bacterium]
MPKTASLLPFTKMQALGNDFVLFEEQNLNSPLTTPQIQWIASRRYGIGCDQVIFIKESSIADAEISFYNADGSQASACGNGTRCVAKYLGKESGLIQTPSFLSQFWQTQNNMTISLKEPTFSPPHPHGHFIDVGNPHLVIFTQDPNELDFATLALSLQPAEGINVELAHLISPTTLKVQIWERGVGITPACGSGACAVGVLSLKLGLIEKPPVIIEMTGGALEVDWAEGRLLLLTGPAEFCFKGMIDLP